MNLEDIERVAPGVANLSTKEHEALQKFTLLWTLFEAQVLENNASAAKIAEKVQNLNLNMLQGDWFKEHLEYFSNRYVENGTTNYRFEHLNLRANDREALVRAVLLGEDKELDSQLTACLIIVFRFRNNFFHGLKWAYGMQEQYDNFTHSAELLTKCIEKFQHSI